MTNSVSRLPTPSDTELAHAARMHALIADKIIEANGWISFAHYMQLALYEPGLGYYVSGAQKFGGGGDFITAPTMSPLYAQAMAAQVAQIMGQIRSKIEPNVLEFGAGDGQLAADLLNALAQLKQLPARYEILEVSPELQARQRDTLQRIVPQWSERVTWRSEWPNAYSGVVLANEVLDAMPASLVVWGERIMERGVGLNSAGNFCWEDRPANARMLAEAEAIRAQCKSLDSGFQSEISLAAQDWVRAWGDILQEGVLLVVDYGFPRREFYHPLRHGGTLMCHYRHHAHPEPFYLPGLQDVSVHLDFSALAISAHDAGLSVYGYTHQARALFNCGLLDVLSSLPSEGSARLQANSAVNQWVSPSEMGELFKWIAVGRGVKAPLLAFRQGDKRHTL